MGNFARSLGLARVTPVVGGYGFGSPHSLGGAIPVISSDPWIARRGAQHGRGSEARRNCRNGRNGRNRRNGRFFVCRDPSHPVLPYDTYHITLSDFALRPPMSGRFVSNFTLFYDHSSL